MLNEADTIEGTLKSLQILRSKACELIVVDGGSQDATCLLAEPLADYVLASDTGRAIQMNAGAAQAKGKVLLFLHADTRLPADAHQLIIKGLEVSQRQWGYFAVRLSGKQGLFRLIETMMTLRSRLTNIATGDQAMFVTRRLFKSVEGFPGIALMEDITLSRQLKHTGRPLCIAQPVLTSSRRWEDKGIIRTLILMWSLRVKYFLGADSETLRALYQ